MAAPLGSATITLLYAVLATAWIVGSGSVLTIVSADPVTQGRIELAKGIAFVLVSSGLLYLLLRRRDTAALRVEDPQPLSPDGPERRRRLAVAVAMLVLTVPIVGLGVFAVQAQREEEDSLTDLRVIADFKAGQIEGWLNERRNDAASLVASRGFVQRIAAMQRGRRDAESAFIVQNRIDVLVSTFAYSSIRVIAPEGRVMTQAGIAATTDEHDLAALAEHARLAGEVVLQDLHADAPGNMHFAIVAPIGLPERFLGAAVFEIDAGQFLFPVVHAWPLASQSGEALLVRADNQEVRFLNQPRLNSGADRPEAGIDDQRLPAAAALRARVAGSIRGVDYRGTEVLAAWRPVNGTSWSLVAKVDRREALASARTTSLWVTGIAAVAVGFIAMALVLLLREQRRSQRLALRVQSDRLLRHFYDMPFVGMAITRPVSGEWILFNDQMCALGGYSRAELQDLRWPDLVHADDFPSLRDGTERMLRGESDTATGEARFLRKDGGLTIANFEARCVRKPDGAVDYIVTTAEDVTERRAAEAKILKLSRLYLTLSRCNVAIAHAASEQALFDDVCRIAVEAGGARLALIAKAEADGGLRAVAVHGAGADEMRDVRFVSRPGLPDAPALVVMRTLQPVWIDDMRRDPRTQRFAALVSQHGWVGSATLPLLRGDQAVGFLGITLGESEPLDDETRQLLMEISTDIGFGLQSLAREADRRAALDSLARRARQQSLVAELGQFALANNHLDDVVERCTAALGEGLHTEFSQLLRLTDDRRAVQLVAGSGWTAGSIGRMSEAAQGALPLEYLRSTRAPLVVEDFATDARFTPSTLLRTHGIASGLETLIGPPESPWGALGVYSRERRAFTPDDVGFLVSVAAALSSAIERKAADDRLTHIAQHDALTGLPNRLLLVDRLRVALAQARRANHRLAVLFMDLDRFKNVNDSFGHELGDRVLREAGLRLRGAVRASDTVSRQGGDEFLVVLPEIDDEQDAARVSQKLLESFTAPFSFGGNEIVMSASIGIACYPENGSDAETLLRNADAAMYSAKEGGRNRYGFYSADMNARSQDRLLLESDLRRALERSQLFVCYQPQVALRDGAVIGMEALVRWQHPVRGTVGPAEFIRIAEESGMIAPIGQWVLETACSQRARWAREGFDAGSVSVNVSAYQFRQHDFPDAVARALAQTGLDPRLLELEVTESVVMRGVQETLAKLNDLSRLGVRLAIDDFGTGYSSLSYLKQFPLHRLKIDQSFTRGLPGDRSSGAISQAVISLGHSLGLEVLAEGVETEAQQAHLRALGCDTAQGYLYAKPMPVEDMTRFLQAQRNRV